MTKFNTGNPLGSSDPRDFYDNASSADHALNSELPTFVDRLGKKRPTLAGAIDPTGIVQQAADAAARAEDAVAAAFAAADVYSSVKEGRESVEDGEQFQVVMEGYLIRYRRDSSSTQTEMAKLILDAASRVAPIITIVTTSTSNKHIATVGDYHSYQTGDSFIWIPDKENTGPVTININSLGDFDVSAVSGMPASAGDFKANAMYLIRISDGGRFALASGGGAVQSGYFGDSLKLTNPNLIRPEQYGAISRLPEINTPIKLDSYQGINCWSTTDGVRRFAVINREEIKGDIVSSGMRILGIENPGAPSRVRLLLMQLDAPRSDGGVEVDRSEINQPLVNSEYITISGMELAPECESIEIYIGVSGGGSARMYFRDINFCEGIDGTFRPYNGSSIRGTPQLSWVSPTGSDSGGVAGQVSRPFKTLNAAIVSMGGEGSVYVKAGDYSGQSIDARNVVNIKVFGIPSADFNRPTFRYGNRLDGIEVVGKTGVYSAPCSAKPAWLWADNVPDVSTEIPNSERHALQQGRKYRLNCTKIKHQDFEDMSAALNFIESSPEPVCWYDSIAGTVYYNMPAGASVGGIYEAKGGLVNNTRSTWGSLGQLELYGIDVRYGNINTKSFLRTYAHDTHIIGAEVNGFDLGNWSKFSFCSAGGCGSGDGLGDGFNAHNFAVWEYDNCYGYDNWDDGESSHEYCVVTGTNSVMEYNGGAGFIPAYGAKQTLINCTSRKNATAKDKTGGKKGGYQAGGNPSASDPGVMTSLNAYNCVSIGDGNGFYDGTSSSPPDKIKLTAVNCKVFDAEGVAYGCAEIVDCYESGSGSSKSMATVVKNTNLVV